ncbi:MAG: AI-2E family transporter [Actinomycetota bacterium]|nr:AI-2E family transporter [Actinomycetota bacterium]
MSEPQRHGSEPPVEPRVEPPVEQRPVDPLGAPGRPLARHSPFYLGFFGALGVLVAMFLASVAAAASSVLVLVVVAMFLAVGLDPVVQALVRRGVRRGLAVTVVTVAVVLALMLFVVALVPVISDQVAAIVEATPEIVQRLQETQWIRDLDRRFDLLDRAAAQIRQGGLAEQLAGGVLGVGLAVLNALANTLVVFILTLYFLASLPRVTGSAYRLVPASRRERVRSLGDEILRRIGSYVSGAFLVAALAAVSSLVFLVVVGLGQYAVALAFVVGVLSFIPLVGATIAAIIVSAIGLAADPVIGLACLIFYIVYQQVENYLIYPRVMARSVDVPGAVTVVAALIGGTLLGIVGALLAIPTAAAILLVVREVLLRRQDTR